MSHKDRCKGFQYIFAVIDLEFDSQMKSIVPLGIVTSRSDRCLPAVLTEGHLYIVFTGSSGETDVGELMCFDVCSREFIDYPMTRSAVANLPDTTIEVLGENEKL